MFCSEWRSLARFLPIFHSSKVQGQTKIAREVNVLRHPSQGIATTMGLKDRQADSKLFPDLTVRLATDEDYDDVMDIQPNLYGGRDYLPKYYHSMIRHPRRIPLLFLLSKEILGFGVMLVINDGTAVVRQAGRVTEKYRGRGFNHLAMKISLDYIWKQYPQVTTWHTVLTGDSILRSLVQKDKAVQRHSYRCLTRARMEEFGNVSTNIPKYKDSGSDCLLMDATRILTPSEALGTLTHLEDVHKIRGDYIWLVNGELFEHNPSDYTLLTQSNVIPAVVAVTHGLDNASVDALSFGTKTLLSNGFLFRVDFYCAEQHRASMFGERLLKCHLQKHLVLFAQENHQGLAYVDVLVPKEMMSSLKGNWLSECLPQSHSLLETELKVYFVQFSVEPFQTMAKL